MMKRRYSVQLIAGLLLCLVYLGIIYFRIGIDQTLMTLVLTPGLILAIAIELFLRKERFYKFGILFFTTLFILTSYNIFRLIF